MNLFYYITLIAMTILYEAPHQPRMGQELVAHTIVNRAQLSGMDIESVVMQRGQYAGWTREHREKWLRAAIEGELPRDLEPVGHLNLIWTGDGWRKATVSDWWAIWWLSAAVVMGKAEPAGFEGVTHFDNLAFWDGEEPPWAGAKERLGKVGDHVFYR